MPSPYWGAWKRSQTDLVAPCREDELWFMEHPASVMALPIRVGTFNAHDLNSVFNRLLAFWPEDIEALVPKWGTLGAALPRTAFGLFIL